MSTVSDHDPKYVPVKMNLSRSQGLTIVWGDGRRCAYSCYDLRLNSPCATQREVRRKMAQETNPLAVLDASAIVAPDVTITDVQEVGNYALQFTFSDGHHTGIYDYKLLRDLDETAAKSSAANAEATDQAPQESLIHEDA